MQMDNMKIDNVTKLNKSIENLDINSTTCQTPPRKLSKPVAPNAPPRVRRRRASVIKPSAFNKEELLRYSLPHGPTKSQLKRERRRRLRYYKPSPLRQRSNSI